MSHPKTIALGFLALSLLANVVLLAVCSSRSRPWTRWWTIVGAALVLALPLWLVNRPAAQD
jgi:hypothetical protein